MKAARILVLGVAACRRRCRRVSGRQRRRGETRSRAGARRPAVPDRRRADRQERYRHGHRRRGEQDFTGRPGPRPPPAHLVTKTTGRTHRRVRRRDHARAVHRGRADPRSQADQGQRRRRLHGGDPAVRHARGVHRNFAGNRRRRLHPAERPRRRDPVAARQQGDKSAGNDIADQRNDSRQCARSRDRPDRRGKKRPARRGRQDRDARARAAPGRNARAVAAARHAVAGAAQPARRQQATRRAGRPRQRRHQHRSVRREHQTGKRQRSTS